MFDPIVASNELKESFVDYISTTFTMQDEEYMSAFKAELSKAGMISKGPYIDIGGSYKKGKSIQQMIDGEIVSPLFEQLETVPEDKKEIPIKRTLYTHQEEALKRASQGHNLVVTTGTGSGKTECFLLPILNHLLREIETTGFLSPGVRAILIYPMNALANDQIKRMRNVLANYPEIKFGLYNGDTENEQPAALKKYRAMHKDKDGNGMSPLPNEVISREKMRDEPPQILITNYSMLEYMMLRPNDDKVFSGAKLKFIVLDEAHIYKGATGMETSLLMRRLKARISDPKNVQYILTSATLGDKKDNGNIINFAENLCGTSFAEEDIIRSDPQPVSMVDSRLFPMSLFEELYEGGSTVSDILKAYDADFAPEASDAEKLYELFVRSKMFGEVRRQVTGPVTVAELRNIMSAVTPVSDKQVVAFIAVCAKAEKGGSALIKPRYHFFVRALEGCYITLKAPKSLYLTRKTEEERSDGEQAAVFEAAVCMDCGRIAVVGDSGNGKHELKQVAKKASVAPEYYLIKSPDDSVFFDEEPDEEDEEPDEESEYDYVLCPTCGAISTSADAMFDSVCEHDESQLIKLRQIHKFSDGRPCCPACGTGTLRQFYLGSEAATGVLGTALYDLLPDKEETYTPGIPEKKSLFGRASKKRTITKEKNRQFLCFSDSRSDAASFATYMERSYNEFLRRRGVWHVADALIEEGKTRIDVSTFVKELTKYFAENKCFDDWEGKSPDDLESDSKSEAWKAVVNELYSMRRGTGLCSMGKIAFQYKNNDDIIEAICDKYSISETDARALFELLIQDAVFTGALNAGKSYTFSGSEREYLFFSEYPKKLVKVKTDDKYNKKPWLKGWCGRTRPNGGYYSNTKLTRLIASLNISDGEANELLEKYWENIFEPDSEEYALNANDFRILLGGTDGVKFYKCKKCGRVTPYSFKGKCASVKCSGMLEPYEPLEHKDGNHYIKLYESDKTKPLHMKEHTAQLAKTHQTKYQEAFINGQLNALSCSTTFEMGVDLGSLETVYMRDVPPSPANYVQRAGRAGRSKDSAAFVLTYAKLSSHDFTYYQNPIEMISGKIKAPVFELENRKIMLRHTYAVALSSFFAMEENYDVYNGDNQDVFLNDGGYERFKAYLYSKPEGLKKLLIKSIPAGMHDVIGITDYSWVESLCGENGTLEIAVEDFKEHVRELESALEKAPTLEEKIAAKNSLSFLRAGKNDTVKNRHIKKGLIEFLVRNNVLPKYGFPVDTVTLSTDNTEEGRGLELQRDLQLGIADYAPGSEVVADGHMYVSRYLKKYPGKLSWEKGFYCRECPTCKQPNFTKDIIEKGGRECVACHSIISKQSWLPTLEPRFGFIADKKVKDVPMHRPEHDYKTDDYYIGDPTKNVINRYDFQVNGKSVTIESTANDSLAVVGETAYYVCYTCGYANSDPAEYKKHKDTRGFPCEGAKTLGKTYNLAHDFKTDVAKITFYSEYADRLETMLSVLYAMLEGLSQELGIERTDIKGCLFVTPYNGRMIYSLVLYDAVAGGAGHVRRLVTDDGAVLLRVIKKAISIVDGCDCDTSCYKCLRNYYNQKIHDLLDRNRAKMFLREWVGSYTPVELDHEEETSENDISEEPAADLQEPEVIVHYAGGTELAGMPYEKVWSQVAEAADDELLRSLKNLTQGKKPVEVPWMDAYIQIGDSTEQIYPDLIWEKHKTLLFLSDNEEEYLKAKSSGWKCYWTADPAVSAEEIVKSIEGE